MKKIIYVISILLLAAMASGCGSSSSSSSDSSKVQAVVIGDETGALGQGIGEQVEEIPVDGLTRLITRA